MTIQSTMTIQPTMSLTPAIPRFLLAGLSDGSMQFVYLSRKKLLTSQPLAPPKSPSIDGSFDHFAEPQRTFVASTFSGSPASAQMSLVTAEGTIFLFTSVQVGQDLLSLVVTLAQDVCPSLH